MWEREKSFPSQPRLCVSIRSLGTVPRTHRCPIYIHGRVKDEKVKGRKGESEGRSTEADMVGEEEGCYNRHKTVDLFR